MDHHHLAHQSKSRPTVVQEGISTSRAVRRPSIQGIEVPVLNTNCIRNRGLNWISADSRGPGSMWNNTSRSSLLWPHLGSRRC